MPLAGRFDMNGVLGVAFDTVSVTGIVEVDPVKPPSVSVKAAEIGEYGPTGTPSRYGTSPAR